MSGVDGSGVSVGVLSDSYDILLGAAADVTSGDLPAGVSVLSEYSLCGSFVTCIDEGRAMLQIVHDVAPGADLLFHTAMGGVALYAMAITNLAAAGADVIVDDLVYLNEPMFQDGIVAQAVDSVVAGGAAYFSAAGNQARNSYESAFVDSGEDLCIDLIPNGTCDPIFELVGDVHDFDPGPGVDFYQSISIPVGASLSIAFQWDALFGNVNTGDGPDNDHDIVLLDETGGVLITLSANDNVTTGEPWEILQYFNDGTYGTSFNIAITFDDIDSPGLPATLLKIIVFGGGISINDFPSNSSSLLGHANAAGDGDGLSDLEELAWDGGASRYNPALDLNPLSIDTDDDGFKDGMEVAAEHDPLNGADSPVWGDIDDNGIVDTADVLQATRAVLGITSLTNAEKARGNVAPLVDGQPQSTFDDEFGLPDLLIINRKALAVVTF